MALLQMDIELETLSREPLKKLLWYWCDVRISRFQRGKPVL
jgi:hypothetical protein